MKIGDRAFSAMQATTREETPRTLEQAGQAFERLLVEQMLSAMEQSLEGGLFGRQDTGGEWYTSMFNQEMSRSLAGDGGMGLSRQLLDQLGGTRQASPRQAARTLAVYAGEAKVPRARFTVPAATRREELQQLTERLATELELDPQLATALVNQESGWDERARSVKGAMGLTQLMPATARELGVENPWDAEQNLRGGLRYLKSLLQDFGETGLALAAYNAGPQAVRRHGGVPPYPETRSYVTRILAQLEDRR